MSQNLFKDLRDRTYLCIPEKRWDHLYAFLNGYDLALASRGECVNIYDGGCFDASTLQFYSWCRYMLPPVLPEVSPEGSYYNLLLKASDGDQYKAFDLFFECLDSYLRREISRAIFANGYFSIDGEETKFNMCIYQIKEGFFVEMNADSAYVSNYYRNIEEFINFHPQFCSLHLTVEDQDTFHELIDISTLDESIVFIH